MDSFPSKEKLSDWLRRWYALKGELRFREAADEIERLQRENETLASELTKWTAEALREKSLRHLASELPAGPPWHFERYRSGSLKAEGIAIEKASGVEQAIAKAARMADAGDVLVLRTTTPPEMQWMKDEIATLEEDKQHLKCRILALETAEPPAVIHATCVGGASTGSVQFPSEHFATFRIPWDTDVPLVGEWLLMPAPTKVAAPPPAPLDEPAPRYQCMVAGCPANHASKRDVCDTRPSEAIAVWLDAEGNFQWDFEINEDHPIDAAVAIAKRTNWEMTDEGWRLALTKETSRIGAGIPPDGAPSMPVETEAPLPVMKWDACSSGGLWRCTRCNEAYCSPPWNRKSAAMDHRAHCKPVEKEPTRAEKLRAALEPAGVKVTALGASTESPACRPLLHLFSTQGEPCLCGSVPWGQPSNTPVAKCLCSDVQAAYVVCPVHPTAHEKPARDPRCDCQCPEPASGAALVSMTCPVHNELRASIEKPESYYCTPCMRDVPIEHKENCPHRASTETTEGDMTCCESCELFTPTKGGRCHHCQATL